LHRTASDWRFLHCCAEADAFPPLLSFVDAMANAYLFSNGVEAIARALLLHRRRAGLAPLLLLHLCLA
jgi:hypothetical protein